MPVVEQEIFQDTVCKTAYDYLMMSIHMPAVYNPL
jgi:hypothetical protein